MLFLHYCYFISSVVIVINGLENNLTLGVLKLMLMQCFLTGGLKAKIGLLSCFDREVSSWTLPLLLRDFKKLYGKMIIIFTILLCRLTIIIF